MVDFFVFPYTYEDILKSSDTRFCVNAENERRIKNMEDKRIRRTLGELESAFVEDYTELKSNDRFDTLFYLIDGFGTKNSDSPNLIKYSLSTIESTGELLTTYLNSLLRRIKEDCASSNTSPSVIADDRHALKMIVFLTTFFLRNTCVKRISVIKEENTEDAPQSKKGKKANNTSTSNDENFDNLIERQRQCVELLQRTLAVDLKTLFQKKSMDDEFYKYYLTCALRVLESKPLIKQEKARSSIFSIVRTVMKVFADSSKQELKQIQLNFINLIYEDDNLVQPIADFIIELYNDQSLVFTKEFTFDMLQILVTFLQEKTPSSESIIFKNARDFFSILSNHLPKIFINNLSCFLALFDSESYLMRNTVSEILGNILKNVLTAQNAEDEEFIGNEESKIKQKERLLERLIDRIFDKHAYSRAQVLTILADLCESNSIPPHFLPTILKAAIGRTKDVGSIVRRKALQLISRVVNYYAYIYKANKDGKFITKDQVVKEIRKLEMQVIASAAQIEQIDEKLRELTSVFDPADLVLKQDEIEVLVSKQKSIKSSILVNEQLQSRYKEYQDFLFAIDILIPILVQLLGSKSVYDVLETIRLLTHLRQYNITSSEQGIKKMIVLVWSKDRSIKEEVLSTYWSLYMNSKELKAKGIAKNLISLMVDTNITEQSSFEELLLSMMDSQKLSPEEQKTQNLKVYQIHQQVFSEVWEVFTKNFRILCEADAAKEHSGAQPQQQAQNSEQEKEYAIQKKEMRSAIQILRIASDRQKANWNLKLESFKNILSYYKKNIQRVDWVVVRELGCIAEQVKSDDNLELVKQIAQILSILLVRSHGTEDTEWFQCCEQILKLTFVAFPNPESIIKYLIRQMSEFLHERRTNAEEEPIEEEEEPLKDELEAQLETQNKSSSSNKSKLTSKLFEHKLAQVLFLAGNSALKFLLHCDKIEEYLNKRRIEAENNKQKEAQNNNPNEDKDLDKINGGFEAEYEEHLRTLHNISDKLILESPIFSYFCSVSQKVCWNMFNSLSIGRDESHKLRRNVILDRVAVLCLIKFMCVSSQVCKKNLDLIFNMLESQADSIVKTNILIGIGDLYHRYPNVIERYLHFVYKSLSDSDPTVRKTCLMVITHLVLNDMLKVKAEISSIAVLIQDDDSRIQNMVKLFFHELNKKDPKAIYNLLPELIGRLSQENVNEKIFLNFCENVLPHIDRDKQAESLIEKLCQRFSITHTEKEWVNISLALKMFSYNEKGLKKLLEYFESYREKLNTPQILESFMAIVLKVKKMPRQSQEHKSLLEEFEAKVVNFKKETFDEKKYKKEKPKPKVNPKAAGQPGGQKKTGKQNTNVPAAGATAAGNHNNNKTKKKEPTAMDIESEEEEDEDIIIHKKGANKGRQEQAKQSGNVGLSTRRKSQPSRGRAQKESESDGGSFDEEDADEEVTFKGRKGTSSSRQQQPGSSVLQYGGRVSLRGVNRKSLKEPSDNESEFDEEED